ncbi:sensor domain-containing protein [Streptomyces sp. NPDC051183]|uniref:sensor histidine kinase n=1 Tax=Streptomyces sp. NPDC051183 TaxID=3155165 RepID=UPI00341481A9
MHPTSVWQALAQRRYLLGSWPWRATGYLLGGVCVGAVTLVALLVLTLSGTVLAVVVVGLVLLVLAALCGIPVAAVERRRLRPMGAPPVPDAHVVPPVPGLWGWLRTRLLERATWRELAHAVLLACVVWLLEALLVLWVLVCPLAATATPVLFATVGGGRELRVVKLWTVTSYPGALGVMAVGLVCLAAAGYVLGVAAGARAALARAMLVREGPEVREVVRSRARLVDAFEAERRRIERDLHDGAQQRLVALSMALGLARLDAPAGPLADRLAAAQDEAGKALTELRELIHNIHPQVLADYGLEAAVQDAADRSPVPVAVAVDLPERLPEAVEAAAYFVVNEALANVAKHSGADRAWVHGGHRAGRLVLEIGDDGRGGADFAAGSGLVGLADRVAVLDGTLSLKAPAGGPTVLRMEIPCRCA